MKMLIPIVSNTHRQLAGLVLGMFFFMGQAVAQYDEFGNPVTSVTIVVVGSEQNQILIYSPTGELENDIAATAQQLAVIDSDNDGLDEIIADDGNNIAVYELNGEISEPLSVESVFFVKGDVDGDGTEETIIGAQDANEVSVDDVTFTVFDSATRRLLRAIDIDDEDDEDYEDNGIGNDDDEDNGTGNGDQKVTICHIPPGNPSAAHTITISVNALQTHIDHGDTEGACPDSGGDDQDDQDAQNDQDDQNDQDAQDDQDDQDAQDDQAQDTTSTIYGVNVAAGDLNGDGKAEIVAAMASNGGRIEIRTGDGTLINGFEAFDSTQGVLVAVGDVTGDGQADIIAAEVNGTEILVFDANGNQTGGFQVSGNIISLAIGNGLIEAEQVIDDNQAADDSSPEVDDNATDDSSENEDNGNANQDSSNDEDKDEPCPTTGTINRPCHGNANQDSSNNEDKDEPCPTTGTINRPCHGGNQQAPTDAALDANCKTSEATLTDDITHHLWGKNVTIFHDTIFNGGKMTGCVENHGIIKDIFFFGDSLMGGKPSGKITVNSDIKLGMGIFKNATLLPNTIVKDVLFTGKITGHAKNCPRVEDVQFLENTEVSHVIIGKGTHFAKGVMIGVGVRFVSNYLIPDGADLTAAISTGYAEYMPQAVDMNDDVVTEEDVRSLLAQVNDLSEFKRNGWQLTQNPETGQLELTVGNISYAVIPVGVKQTNAKKHGKHFNRDGSIDFVTAKGRHILAYPGVQKMPALDKPLAKWGLGKMVLQKNGILSAKFKGGKVVARADIAAYPVSDDEPLGLFTTRHSDSVRLVFADDKGQKREQLIHPFCADPEALYNYQARLQDGTDLDLAHNGTVSLTIKGKRYHGVFDYVVRPGSKYGKKPKQGQLMFTPIYKKGKKVSFTVTYPTGETQTLWLMGNANP
ncbi:MAG TPA: VCBS repeat-containing protein [Thioploca sp.]|nr:VCBS repeat-containing protein [Thioploca sp.]